MTCDEIFCHIEVANIVVVDSSLLLNNTYNHNIDIDHPSAGEDTFLSLKYEGVELDYTVNELRNFRYGQDGQWINEIGQSLVFYRMHNSKYNLLDC